jgi:hypothetical protein
VIAPDETRTVSQQERTDCLILHTHQLEALAPLIAIETGSVRVARQVMAGKALPFDITDWPHIVLNGLETLREDVIAPAIQRLRQQKWTRYAQSRRRALSPPRGSARHRALESHQDRLVRHRGRPTGRRGIDEPG